MKIIILVLFWLMAIFFGVDVVFMTAVNIKFDTLPITNIGFAIALTTASTCFSWYRTFPDTTEHESVLKKIRTIGERSMYAAMLFLLASMAKYCAALLLQLDNPNVFHGVGYGINHALFFVGYFFSYFLFLWVIHDLIIYLADKY